MNKHRRTKKKKKKKCLTHATVNQFYNILVLFQISFKLSIKCTSRNIIPQSNVKKKNGISRAARELVIVLRDRNCGLVFFRYLRTEVIIIPKRQFKIFNNN